MKVCVPNRIVKDPSFHLVREALKRSRLDVVFAEPGEPSATSAHFRLVFDEQPTVDSGRETPHQIPVVSLADSTGRPLQRSKAIDGSEGRCVEVVAHVLPGDGRPMRKVAGWINDQGGALWTLTSALTVLPTLVARALADDRLPPGGLALESLSPPRPIDGKSMSRRVMAGIARRKEKIFHRRRWWVGLVEDLSIDELVARPNRPLSVRWFDAAGKGRWWADPCSVADGSSKWLFVEEFDRRLGHGRIVGLKVLDGRKTERHVVLSDDHHRALPRIWRSHGKWLATVDTCQSPAPIFTFEQLGDCWVPIDGAFLPKNLSDPVITENAQRWTLTGSLTTEIEDAVTRTWTSPETHETSQPGNLAWVPDGTRARVDIASARGGGSIDVKRQIRAVQDCSPTYGSAVSVIAHPTVGEQRVIPLVRLDGSTIVGSSKEIHGMHTLAWTPGGNFLVTDGWQDVFDLFAFRWNRPAAKPCPGCAK